MNAPTKSQVRDWSRLGADADVAFEQHKAGQIDHFVSLFRFDQGLARSAVKTYILADGCPFPKIGADVKVKLIELGLLEEKAES